MICPRCHAEVSKSTACPGCGLRFVRQVAGFIKTSAVLISTRDDEGFYGSLREVPADLRSRLEAATNGENSGTILIADKGGRERILAKAAGLQREAILAPAVEVNTRPPVWAIWVGAALFVAAVVIIVMVWGKWPNE